MEAVFITDAARSAEASASGDRLVVAPEDLPAAIGWALKPEGLCRDDVCVPVRDRSAIEADGGLDIAAVAGALGRASVVDAVAGVAAVALDGEVRRRALRSLVAPPFELADLDGKQHRLDEWRGRKKLLVAFASW